MRIVGFHCPAQVTTIWVIAVRVMSITPYITGRICPWFSCSISRTPKGEVEEWKVQIQTTSYWDTEYKGLACGNQLMVRKEVRGKGRGTLYTSTELASSLEFWHNRDCKQCPLIKIRDSNISPGSESDSD